MHEMELEMDETDLELEPLQVSQCLMRAGGQNDIYNINTVERRLENEGHNK